jgi:hypothetical protein
MVGRATPLFCQGLFALCSQAILCTAYGHGKLHRGRDELRAAMTSRWPRHCLSSRVDAELAGITAWESIGKAGPDRLMASVDSARTIWL